MKAPGARPVCKHGVGYGGMSGCKECFKEDTAIAEKLKTLVNEFWENRGERRLENLFYRAYRMGMKHEDNP
jgi:hypothetical protein